MHWQQNQKSDEDFEKLLRDNYGHNIRKSKDRKAEMMNVLGAVRNNDAEQEKKFSEVLKGGKGQAKRYSAVDLELYGTDKGVVMKEKYEQEIKTKDANKTQIKPHGKAKGKKSKKPMISKEEKLSKENSVDKATLGNDLRISKTVASGSVVIAALAITGFLIGGKKNS